MSISLVKRFLKGVIFGLHDRFYNTPKDAVMISTHYSILETDSQHLIRTLPDRIDRDIFVVVDSQENPNQLSQEILDHPQITVVMSGSKSFRKALARSQLVILKSRLHLHSYRFLSANNSRDYIVFDHGLITKAYRRHAESSPSKLSVDTLRKHLIDWYSYSGIDVQSVSSEIERFFRSSAEGRHPSYFLEYSYPRYDRINELQESNEESAINDDYKEILDDGKNTNLLYAPTHKDGEYETTLFPFTDFDPDRLRSFLRKNDIRLFLRMHPSEEDHPQLQQLIDDETIYSAGRNMSHSSVEILPFIDVLMTDYSSIYMDFLPFDQPIIFIEDQPDQFEEIRGIAFDYDRYFPGQKVGRYELFERHLRRIMNEGTDGFEIEREFVRQVLLPPRENTTVDNIISHLS